MRTRRAYAGDVAVWLGWLTGRETGALAAGRVHVDLWAATQLDDGAAASSVRRRLSALSSFYRYCAAHDLVGRVATQGVARPAVDPDYTVTVGQAPAGHLYRSQYRTAEEDHLPGPGTASALTCTYTSA